MGKLGVSVALSAILLLLGMTVTNNFVNSNEAADLFNNASLHGEPAGLSDSSIMRSRYVHVNWGLLGGSRSPERVTKVANVLSLNLFDDLDLFAVLDRQEINPTGSLSWIGYIEGMEKSEVVLVVRDEIMMGTVNTPDGSYRIRFLGKDVHVIEQIDQSALPFELEPIPVDSTATHDESAHEDKTDWEADDGSIIDVLVVYTGTARAAVGGAAAMQTLIDLAVTESNIGYGNSGVGQRLRLVHTEEVSYDETSFNWGITLDRLTDPSDGYMDNVHTLRNTYCADEVVLLVRDETSCGLAWLMTTVAASFETHAFALVSYNCATGYYSFAHELGHNMGARHDCDVDSELTPYYYDHGYVYKGTNPWRTIMAYGDACGGCPRLNYWSNDHVKYEGVPMGTSGTSGCQARDYQTLNNTAYTVANFRTACSMGDTTGVFRPSDGALYLKNSNTSGYADAVLTYGLPADKPITGDWDGDGVHTIGVFRDGIFFLKNTNSNGFADLVFAFGQPGDLPVRGDWNGDKKDTIGVYRDGVFFLRNTNDSGPAEMIFSLGLPGDVPIAGDWTKKGYDSVGVFRPSDGALYLKNINATGLADIVCTYGLPGDKPVTGDWNGDGVDTIGIYRDGTFFLRNSNSNGFADIIFSLGIGGDDPVAGEWGALP